MHVQFIHKMEKKEVLQNLHCSTSLKNLYLVLSDKYFSMRQNFFVAASVHGQ